MFGNLFKKKVEEGEYVYKKRTKVPQGETLNFKEATYNEIIERITARHFKKLESMLIELKLPKLVFVSISKEFRYLEGDLKSAIKEKRSHDDENKTLKTEIDNNS